MTQRIRLICLVLGLAVLLRIALASVRPLTADEAYYLCASTRAPAPWPIVDHPPVLGVLLRAWIRWVPASLSISPQSPSALWPVDRIFGFASGSSSLSIELRVRALAILLQGLTGLGVGRLAERLGGPGMEGAFWVAGWLATWGLLPMAGGLILTPDAPLLAALAWILAACAGPRPRTGPGKVAEALWLTALAALAVGAKVSALVILLPMGFQAIGRPRDLRGAGVVVGAILGAVGAGASLRFQLGHAMGAAHATAPHIGPLAAAVALILGQMLLWTPPVMLHALAGRRSLTMIPGLHTGIAALGALTLASAFWAGRPPEPNWLAPAALPLLAAAAIPIARLPLRVRLATLIAYALPTMAAVSIWLLPDGVLPRNLDPFGQIPHEWRRLGTLEDPWRGAETPPPYARAARACVYRHDCAQIDAILRR